MRLLHSSSHIEPLLECAEMLQKKHIRYSLEERENTDWGDEEYGTREYLLWIYEENEMENAKKVLEEFLKKPLSKKPRVQKKPSQDPTKAFLEETLSLDFQSVSKKKKSKRPRFFSSTYFLILLCSLLFLLGLFAAPKEPIPLQVRGKLLSVNPIEKILLFDYPKAYEILDQIIVLWGYDSLLRPDDLPPPGKHYYSQYLNQKTFNGIYPLLLSKEKRPPEKQVAIPKEGPTPFQKIRSGEFWRLITPIFLHGGLLHLLFNMAWLLILGVQMELHIGSPRYLLFILISALVSNSAQYLMSGPAFIGISGVVCSMAFFVYQRQRYAPWEGYFLAPSTFTFIFFFITSLAFLSFLGFILDYFDIASIPIGIANTAHIAGALTGYVLGSLNYFSWRNL